MKKVAVFFVLAMLLLAGCSGVTEPFKVADTEVAENPADGSVSVGPSNQVFVYDAYPSCTIQYWSEDIDSGDLPEYMSAVAGEPMGIVLRNYCPADVKVSISYVRPDYTYNNYQPAPSYVEDWVKTGADTVIVPTGEVWCVPVSLAIGKKKDLPDRFWFGTRVEWHKGSSGGISIINSAIVWWMVTMRLS